MALWLRNHVRGPLNQFRDFVTSSTKNNDVSPNKQNSEAKPSDHISMQHRVGNLTALNRWTLVFSGKYKSYEEIPKTVPIEVLEKARSRTRIRVANYLMILTLVGCLTFAYSGRKAAERGESVQKMNLEWHNDYKNKVKEEEAAKK